MAKMKFHIFGSHMKPSRTLVLGFAGIILLGAILLTLPIAANPGKTVSFLDALFTSTSAVCVTGLVVVDTYNTYSTFGQLVIMSLIQIGGLGFMCMSTLIAVLMGRKIMLRERIILQESMNKDSIEGVVRLALYILKVTITLELLGTVILAITWSEKLGWGRAFYYGLFHSISAFNNAGFDLFGNFANLTGQVTNVPVNLVIGGLIICGGLGFAVIAEVHQWRAWKPLSLHSKLVISTTLILLVLGFSGFALLEWNNPQTLGRLPLGGKFLASMFQSITPRTAGFNTVDFSQIRGATVLLITVLMFIGASPGSTGGGIKTTTFATIVISLLSLIRGSSDFTIAGRRLSKEQVIKGTSIAFMAMCLVTGVAILLSAVEKVPIDAALFEATSAFGTVGLSLGITPKLGVFGKLALVFTMYAGRLGPLTLAIALSRTKHAVFHYPEEKIIIG